MSIRTIITLPGTIIIAALTVIYIVVFEYQLIADMDLQAIANIIINRDSVIEGFVYLFSLAFYLFIFNVIFL